jgi:hypothetical protein
MIRDWESQSVAKSPPFAAKSPPCAALLQPENPRQQPELNENEDVPLGVEDDTSSDSEESSYV